ncbi:50S ribosomal protein L17 [bacterium]|nr:50S ribosomal protein L17 [bacterium]
MKHKVQGRSLGRTANHRRALLRNLAHELLTHRSIVTTLPKAKELQRYVEPLITKAKGELTLATRRSLLRDLSGDDVTELVEVAGQNQDRPGGYTRLTKLPVTRHDNAREVRIDFVATKEAK